MRSIGYWLVNSGFILIKIIIKCCIFYLEGYLYGFGEQSSHLPPGQGVLEDLLELGVVGICSLAGSTPALALPLGLDRAVTAVAPAPQPLVHVRVHRLQQPNHFQSQHSRKLRKGRKKETLQNKNVILIRGSSRWVSQNLNNKNQLWSI